MYLDQTVKGIETFLDKLMPWLNTPKRAGDSILKSNGLGVSSQHPDIRNNILF